LIQLSGTFLAKDYMLFGVSTVNII
jgi:hypothetical protein